MKKGLLAIAGVLFVAGSFTACKKCVTCEYSYLDSAGDLVEEGGEGSAWEYCGDKSTVNTTKESWESTLEGYESYYADSLEYAWSCD